MNIIELGNSSNRCAIIFYRTVTPLDARIRSYIIKFNVKWLLH